MRIRRQSTGGGPDQVAHNGRALTLQTYACFQKNFFFFKAASDYPRMRTGFYLGKAFYEGIFFLVYLFKYHFLLLEEVNQ